MENGMALETAVRIVTEIMTDEGMAGVGVATVTCVGAGFGVVLGHELTGTDESHEFLIDNASSILTSREEYDAWYGAETMDDDDGPGHPETMGCYICTKQAGGDPHAQQGHPLRRVVETFTIEQRRDPTEAYKLDCGHTII